MNAAFLNLDPFIIVLKLRSVSGGDLKLQPNSLPLYLVITQVDYHSHDYHLRVCRDVVTFDAFRIMAQKHNGSRFLLIKLRQTVGHHLRMPGEK